MATKLILVTLILAAMVVMSTQFPYKQEGKNMEANDDFLNDFMDYLYPRGSCVAVGGYGCEANNGKCCRKGNPYTGTMRKCVNVGSFSSPKYQCQE